ncbi:MAG TPA: DNA translocase FtsK 4TM domain-containing protein, partial [Verrucomicrobiae bacterium]|nr:DNA translocase FtsK 4TM domain-containing protein [Verrucomicrobiae bacterium]
MARKASADSESSRGFNDVIGVALIAAALLLFVAQVSFDRNDVSFHTTLVNKPIHNWIGPLGAYAAWWSFLPLGIVGYLLPELLLFFGTAYLLDWPAHFRVRARQSMLWSGLLLVSLTGLLYIAGETSPLGKLHESIGSQSIGGWLGYASYGETRNYQYGLSLLGGAGAMVVYSALLLISLLFLTNFHLGNWIRALWAGSGKAAEPLPVEEQALERRARDLHQQAKKLQEQVERSGLGPDLKPVPEPTVRDLSIPQSRPARARKTASNEPVKEPVPADEEVEVIPGREVAAATSSEVLGKAKAGDKAAEAAGIDGKGEAAPGAVPEPAIHIYDGSGPAAGKMKPARRSKPIAVAST